MAEFHDVTKEKIESIVDAYESADQGSKGRDAKARIDELFQDGHKFVLVRTQGPKDSEVAEVVLRHYGADEVHNKIVGRTVRKRKGRSKKWTSTSILKKKKYTDC